MEAETVSKPIRSISDTAFWVAVYRTIESSRKDAHFHDPYAKILAGEHGEKILRSMPRARSSAWSIITRTCIFDELIQNTIEKYDIDAVINIGAGLDTRPFRLQLPPSLRWVELDLPEILSYKQDKLQGNTPKCVLESFELDITDSCSRREIFEKINKEVKKALVISEGVLVYLSAEEASLLAEELRENSNFMFWITDIISPSILKRLQNNWNNQLASANAQMKFAPEEGADYFIKFGWNPLEARSTVSESRRLNRRMPMDWLFRFFEKIQPKEQKKLYDRAFTGTVLYISACHDS